MTPRHATAMRAATSPRHLRGLTLVELLVAMTIGLIVVLAASASLIASRSGARTVDAASQLRDDARFATDVIQRLAVQAGFEDVSYATQPYRGTLADYQLANSSLNIQTLQPNIYGFNNASPSASDPLNDATPRATGSLGFGSDVLILRYQSVSTNGAPGGPTDGSMIDCAGNAVSTSSINRGDRIASILSVAAGPDGEPTLQCTVVSTGATGTTFTSSPLVKGVENFQVLYGVDHVTAGTVPAGNATGVPDRYLRADQLTVSGNQAATNAAWRRVRSIRIGLVLRGPLGSAAEKGVPTPYYPLGSAGYSGTDDAGSRFRPDDTRLRQVVTFTVQLRNCQNQGYQPSSSTQPCDVVMPS